MILATYENTVVGDRLFIDESDREHIDTVIRKYDKGSKALVLACSQLGGDEYAISRIDELPLYGFGIELNQPAKPETDKFGTYSVFVVTSNRGETVLFNQYHNCRECKSNLNILTNPEFKGYGYVPHYYSSYCRSGKRPHCTCDLCF